MAQSQTGRPSEELSALMHRAWEKNRSAADLHRKYVELYDRNALALSPDAQELLAEQRRLAWEEYKAVADEADRLMESVIAMLDAEIADGDSGGS